MRLLITFSLICYLSLGFAQNIPNGGFESWETEDFFRLDNWVSYGFPERTEESNSGNYAVKLVNYVSANQGIIYGSSLYNVDWVNGTVDKFPYDGDPLSMVFDTKHELGPGDTADLIAGFYEKGNWIGDAKIQLDGSTNNQYVTYSVAILWYSLSRTPDSVFIGMRSSIHPEAKAEGYVILDDFRFENIGARTVEIENYDFENWSNIGVRYPQGFMSLDLVAFKEWRGFLLNPSVTIDSNAFRGESCLRVSNFDDWDNRIGEGACFTGDTFTDAYSPAFAVDQKYTYLQGYYKYNKGGGDAAKIELNMFINGTPYADGSITFSQTKSEWTFFNIPVNYFLDLVPDSATIRIVSAEDGPNNSSETVLHLDELSFVNELDNRVSVANISQSNIKVYPNPFRGQITIESTGGGYVLNTMTGQEVVKGTLLSGEQRVDLKALNPGIYLLTITENNQSTWQQNIIKP
jgi:hypothetical protein